MGPKVEAACRFVEATGGMAAMAARPLLDCVKRSANELLAYLSMGTASLAATELSPRSTPASHR